jgi:lipoic acid synthetase
MEKRLPPWFKQEMPNIDKAPRIQKLLAGLHTVCEEAQCPNVSHCLNKGTATFLIMGSICTRNCSFCAIDHGQPLPLDPDETQRVISAAVKIGLKYVVVTSVTRDDLPDFGAGAFSQAIYGLHNEKIKVEVLIPDLQGNKEAIDTVINSHPEVLALNIETVPRLYKDVRPGADYYRSLNVLKYAKQKDPSIVTKSSIMIGLGETEKEIINTLFDLKDNLCDIVTIGQYLSPSGSHHEVVRYYTPKEFRTIAKIARFIGFSGVVATPLCRSSYEAKKLYLSTLRTSRNTAK